MPRKPKVVRPPCRNSTKTPTHAFKSPMSAARSPSPPPMLKPGEVDLPEPREPGVKLVAVESSMQTDARHKFAAAYEDIAQCVEKCEHMLQHDELYDKSYKSLSKTIAEIKKTGTDAKVQERQQLYNAVLDWLNTSSITQEAPTHGTINEHQLVESGQITRGALMKMLLSIQRLRTLHTTIVEKARTGAELTSKQTDKPDNRRQIKTAAAEIVQQLHEEHSTGGGELVELYPDKIRYLLAELDAQANMIEELRAQLNQQVPLKLPGPGETKFEAVARQVKQVASSQQHKPSGEDEEEDAQTAAAVSTPPDFNKQLIATLQKELDDCRLQNAALIAQGHEAAAKVRFLTEEGNKKDEEIAELQANIIEQQRKETREAETVGASIRRDSDILGYKQPARRLISRTGQRRQTRDSVELPDTTEEEASSAGGCMKLTKVNAAAKRQKRPSRTSQQSAADTLVSPQSSSSQPPADQSTDEVEVVSDATGNSRGRPGHTKPGKQTRGLRCGRGKTGVEPDQVATNVADTTTVATPDEQKRKLDDVVPELTFEQLSSYWQQSAVKEWTPLDMNANNAKDDTTVVQDVDMKEAIEMTQLFVSASKTPHQQSTSAKATRRKSVHEQIAHFATVTSELFAVSSITTDPTTAKLQQQQAAKTPTWSSYPTEASEAASSSQNRAKTAAEAAKQRAARLSVALIYSDVTNKLVGLQSPLATALAASKLAQQPHTLTAPKTTGNTKGRTRYDLVGSKYLAQLAKLLSLKNSSASKTQTTV